MLREASATLFYSIICAHLKTIIEFLCKQIVPSNVQMSE